MNPKEIISLIDEIYLSDTATSKIIEKDKSKEYDYWKSITKGKNLLDNILFCDTTGQNLGFTYFQELIEKYEFISITDKFYVQKSCIGNFATFYVKSNITRKSEGEIISYSTNLICEPIGKFKAYFNASWEYLNRFYPNLIYVPFNILKLIPSNSDKYKIKRNCNLYELLFGYEGNILRFKIIGNKHYCP